MNKTDWIVLGVVLVLLPMLALLVPVPPPTDVSSYPIPMPPRTVIEHAEPYNDGESVLTRPRYQDVPALNHAPTCTYTSTGC